MIIHSVTPYTFLMPQMEADPTTYREMGNCQFQGENTPDGFKIDRVISTNPADYLNPNFMPGKMLR